jgi:uncharacterized protein
VTWHRRKDPPWKPPARPLARPPARPPLPPFSEETSRQKVRGAEDAWNSHDPDRVSGVHTLDTVWRNRAEFPRGRDAVRFAYEWHDDTGQWFRSYGNKNWDFNPQGLMPFRYANINDLPIAASARLFHWPLGRRPDEHPGLSALGL